MTTEQRFQFNGFVTARHEDTDTHLIEVGTLNVGDSQLTVTLIQKKGLGDFAQFLIASVKSGEKLLWQFPRGKYSLGFLARVHSNGGSDELVIALLGKMSGKVEDIVSLSDLLDEKVSGVRRSRILKIAAAKYLKKDYVLSSGEEKIGKIDFSRKMDALNAEELRKKAEREARRKERLARVTSRQQVQVLAEGNERRHGLPVTAEEWKLLPDNTFVVLVDSIGEDDKIGTALETFIVKRFPGKDPVKYALRHVRNHSVTRGAASLPKAARSELFELNDDAHEVPVYASMDDIRALRRAGLNSGALAAVPVPGELKKYTVYRVHHDQIETIGERFPL